MKRVLIFGNSPLPNEDVKKRPSEGLRTWQFVKSLAASASGVAGTSGVSGTPSASGASSMARTASNGKLVPKDGYNIRLVTIALSECYDLEGLGEDNRSDAGSISGTGLRGSFKSSGMKPVSDPLRKDIKYGDYFIHHQISDKNPELMRTLQAVVDEFVPDLIIGVNYYTAYLVSKLKFDCKFWADLNGWTMAKAQIDAYKSGSDRILGDYLKVEEFVLDRATMISTVSEAEKYAVLGELAMMKRLGKAEFEHESVVTIENGLEDFESDKLQKIFKAVRVPPTVDNAWSAGTFSQEPATGLKYFRGNDSYSGADVPSNAFVVLWLGSYSSWVDEETLFKGVEAAMEEIEGGAFEKGSGTVGTRESTESIVRGGIVGARESAESVARGGAWAGGGSIGRDGTEGKSLTSNPENLEKEKIGGDKFYGGKARRKIYFVSTGGLSESNELENKIYLRFKEMVNLSRFKDQFVFLGWVKANHIPYLYEEADCGINVDRRCLETLTGSRNRLLEMMKFSLPCITTFGTEFSYQSQAFGACLGVQSGSFSGVKDAILELYHNPARRKDHGDKGRKYVEQYCSYTSEMRPFSKWMEKFLVGAGEGVNNIGTDRSAVEIESRSFNRIGGGGHDQRQHKTLDIEKIASNLSKNVVKGSASLFKAASEALKKRFK